MTPKNVLYFAAICFFYAAVASAYRQLFGWAAISAALFVATAWRARKATAKRFVMTSGPKEGA